MLYIMYTSIVPFTCYRTINAVTLPGFFNVSEELGCEVGAREWSVSHAYKEVVKVGFNTC